MRSNDKGKFEQDNQDAMERVARNSRRAEKILQMQGQVDYGAYYTLKKKDKASLSPHQKKYLSYLEEAIEDISDLKDKEHRFKHYAEMPKMGIFHLWDYRHLKIKTRNHYHQKKINIYHF